MLPHRSSNSWALLLVVFLSSICVAQEAPDAPIPAQILNAKKIFIANGGSERTYLAAAQTSNADYRPVRTYNEFYAAMKNWGRYETAATPADSDLVLQISTRYVAQEITAPQIIVTMIDPRTNITLWSIAEYSEPAGRQKNREKNYETAIAALIKDVKSLVSPSGDAQSK